MHINLWGNGQSSAVGHGRHAGHREHGKDSAKALQKQATQDVVTALRKRLVSDSSAAQQDGSATDSPMQTLVTTVRTAMSVRVAAGGDAVPDVLGAVRGALGDARAALVKAGASDAEATQAIAAVSEQLGAALSAAPPASADTASAAAAQTPTQAAPVAVAPPSVTNANSASSLSVTAAASNFMLTYVRKQKASLDIVTQEGDQVHFLFRSKEALAASGSSVSTAATANSQTDSSNATSTPASSTAAGSTTAASSPAAASSTTAAAKTTDASAANATTASANGTSTLPAGTKVHAFAAGRVEVSVQGQLSADELKAIGDLVGKVDALANEFFQGDVQKAFNSAAALGFDSSQIAGFALKLSQQESLRLRGTPPGASTPATAPAAPTTAPATTTVPATTTTAGTSAATSAPAPVTQPAPALALDGATAATATAPAATSGSSTTAATDSAAGAAASGDAQAATLQDTLGGFLRKVLDALATPARSGRLEFSMRWKLNLVVAAVESGAPKSAQGSEAGTTLLTRSLKDVASQTQVGQEPISLAPVSPQPTSA